MQSFPANPCPWANASVNDNYGPLKSNLLSLFNIYSLDTIQQLERSHYRVTRELSNEFSDLTEPF